MIHARQNNAPIDAEGDEIQSPECPYCKGIKASKENSLATTNPELVKEWDYSKNGALLPENVLRASHKKVWWICPNGHSYQSVIASRTLQGTSCPICDSEKRTSFPEQAIGYYLEAFTEVLYRSKIEKTEMDIFLPKLNVAIEYDGSYFHSRKGSKERDAKKNEFLTKKGILLLRVAEKKKGPVDSSPKKTKYGYLLNVLYSQNYHFIDALMTAIGQILLAERQVCCKFDVDIDSDRTKIIGRYVNNIKENSVAFKKPIGIKKWDYDKNGDVNPETIPVSSKKRFFWVCPTCGYHWQGAVENLTDTLTCIKCVHADERTYDVESKRGYSLADLFPSIANEWHPTKNGDLTPKDVTPGSNKKVWWKCSKCGNEWEAIIKTRTKGYGCKRCSYEKRTITTTKKRGNIFDFYPELLEQWDYEKNVGIDIKTIAPTSKKEYWWKCPKGHSYLSSPVVKKGSQGCPVCSGKRTDSSNSLASNDPELAKLWDYTKNADKPSEYTCNSGKEKWWVCPSCNASFYKRIQQMHKGKRCPICGVKYRK